MAQIIIRNIPDSVIAVLDEMAEGEGQSREQYIRNLLAEEAKIGRVLKFNEGKLDLAVSNKRFLESNYTLANLAADVRLWVDDTFLTATETHKASQGLLVYNAVRVGRDAPLDEVDEAWVSGFGKGAQAALKRQLNSWRK